MDKNVSHISLISQERRPAQEKQEWKTIKLGKASFPVEAETYEDLKELKELSNNTYLRSVQFVLKNTTKSVVQRQRRMLKSLSEILGASDEEDERAVEFVLEYCRENNLTEEETKRELREFVMRFFGEMGFDYLKEDREKKKGDGKAARAG